MATPYKISLGSRDVGSFHRGGYNAAASAKVSEVLQHNMENWNIHFSGLRHSEYRVLYPLLSKDQQCCGQH